jgi:hypothetical protein
MDSSSPSATASGRRANRHVGLGADYRLGRPAGAEVETAALPRKEKPRAPRSHGWRTAPSDDDQKSSRGGRRDRDPQLRLLAPDCAHYRVCLKGAAGLRPVRVLGALLLTSQSSSGRSGPGRARASRSRTSLAANRCAARSWNTASRRRSDLHRDQPEHRHGARRRGRHPRGVRRASDHAGSGFAGVLARLADGGAHVGEAGEDRWELRVCASSLRRSLSRWLAAGNRFDSQDAAAGRSFPVRCARRAGGRDRAGW